MKVLEIAWKDLLRSARSLFALGMMVVIPLLITGLIYFAFGGMTTQAGPAELPLLAVVVANQDRPPAGAPDLGSALVTFLNDERMPDWLLVSEVDGPIEARSAVDRQAAGAAVIIPPEFTEALLAPGGQSTLVLLQDPTLAVGPAVLEMLLGQFVDGVSGASIVLKVVGTQVAAHGAALDTAAQQQLALSFTDWFASLQQDLNHGAEPLLAARAPGSAAPAPLNPMAAIIGKIMAGMLVFFAFYTGAYTAMSLVTEAEEGTLARLYTTPTPRGAILGGKFLAIGLTLIAQVGVLVAASALAFRIDWGQPASILLAALGLVVAAAGFGILLLSLIKTTKQGGAILGGVLSVTGMLGGLFTTGVEMPPAFQTITLLTPQGWAMRAWEAALAGGSPGAVTGPLLVLVASGGVFFAVGVALARRRFA